MTIVGQCIGQQFTTLNYRALLICPAVQIKNSESTENVNSEFFYTNLVKFVRNLNRLTNLL